MFFDDAHVYPTKDFFEEIDDQLLTQIHLSDPSSLYKICILYSLQLQIEKENLPS